MQSSFFQNLNFFRCNFAWIPTVIPSTAIKKLWTRKFDGKFQEYALATSNLVIGFQSLHQQRDLHSWWRMEVFAEMKFQWAVIPIRCIRMCNRKLMRKWATRRTISYVSTWMCDFLDHKVAIESVYSLTNMNGILKFITYICLITQWLYFTSKVGVITYFIRYVTTVYVSEINQHIAR